MYHSALLTGYVQLLVQLASQRNQIQNKLGRERWILRLMLSLVKSFLLRAARTIFINIVKWVRNVTDGWYCSEVDKITDLISPAILLLVAWLLTGYNCVYFGANERCFPIHFSQSQDRLHL